MQDVLGRLGYDYRLCDTSFSKYDEDEEFIENVVRAAMDFAADCIFSFNYFPDLSRAAERAGVLYISWCYDSPMLTLQSRTVTASRNRIFLFDRAAAERRAKEGAPISYLPLACNTCRADLKNLSGRPAAYEHDITFLGRLYKDEHDFYSSIGYLPERLKGYAEALIESQMLVYGADLITPLMTGGAADDFFDYVKIDMGKYYGDCRAVVLANMLLKQVTVRERERLLRVIGEYYKTDLYAPEKPEGLPVNYMGYADYVRKMPSVFNGSRINLNITLRSIESGIPLRVLDILGAGGFCLTNYQAELPEYFENGRDLVWYESHEDLFDKIGYYINRDEERREIACRGLEKVRSLFSYDTLVPRLFEQSFR